MPGVGDVFSSLTCAYFDAADSSSSLSSLAYTAERAIASLRGVILNTREHAYKSAVRDGSRVNLEPTANESGDNRLQRLSYIELRLVQSAKEILNAPVVNKAQPL